MRMLALAGVLFGVAGCGVAGPPGPQGPVGPQGPAGTGSGGGKLVLSVPANSAERFLMANSATMNEHIFKLGDQVAIPSAATAVYVEVAVCVPDATAAGARVVFATPETESPAELRATRPCSLNVYEARDVWFASTSRDLKASVKSEFGTPPGVMTRAIVRGWFLP